jgi:hypothetical protein
MSARGAGRSHPKTTNHTLRTVTMTPTCVIYIHISKSLLSDLPGTFVP